MIIVEGPVWLRHPNRGEVRQPVKTAAFDHRQIDGACAGFVGIYRFSTSTGWPIGSRYGIASNRR
jgi:hypothetical protein